MRSRGNRSGPLNNAGSSDQDTFRPPAEQRWVERLEELRKFKEQHGHCNVPRKWPANPSLSFWVINQRREIRLGRVDPHRLRELEGLGVCWRTAEVRAHERELHWNRLCDELHSFLRTHGHCDVPEGWSRNPELARWVVRQRHLKRTGRLPEDRLRRFEERGIDWSLEPRQSRSRDRAWERMYFALMEFRKAHGHCDVPKNWPEHPKLARWVLRQRYLLRHWALQSYRRTRLEELGFPLPAAPSRPATARRPRKRNARIRDAGWREQYELLRRFKETEGHCDVPRRLAENPELARWVSYQRELRSADRLSAARIVLLDQLDFPWSGRDGLQRDRDEAWEKAFSRLAAYQQEHGDCEVPARYAADPFLGRWVAAQRTGHRHGRLRPERVKRLTGLGFTWHEAKESLTRREVIR